MANQPAVTWVDRIATEPTPPGVRYDEILLGAEGYERSRRL